MMILCRHCTREYVTNIVRRHSTVVDPTLQTHSVPTADVIKAIKHLKNNEHNDDGLLISLYNDTKPKTWKIKLFKFRQLQEHCN